MASAMLSVCTLCQGDGNIFNFVGFSMLGFEHFARKGISLGASTMLSVWTL